MAKIDQAYIDRCASKHVPVNAHRLPYLVPASRPTIPKNPLDLAIPIHNPLAINVLPPRLRLRLLLVALPAPQNKPIQVSQAAPRTRNDCHNRRILRPSPLSFT